MKQFFSFSFYIFKILRRSRTVYAAAVLSAAAVLLPVWLVPDSSTTAQGLTTCIKYASGLATVAALMGAVWTGCIFASGQIETWRMHLLRVRPVSPLGIVSAQVSGVYMAFLVPLIFAVVLLLIIASYLGAKLPEKEFVLLKENLLTVKEKVRAEKPDLREDAERLANGHIRRSGLPEGYTREMLVQDYIDNLSVRAGEMPPSALLSFLFTGVQPEGNRCFINYRVNVSGSYDQEMKVYSDAIWYLKHPVSGNPYPMKVRYQSGKLEKLEIDSDFIAEDGSVYADFENRDENRRLVYFSVAARPEVVIEKRGVSGNIVRTVFYTLLLLLFFSALGVTAGMLFSAPVAMFFCFVYVVLGALVDLKLLRDIVAELAGRVAVSPFSNDAVIQFSEGLEVSNLFLMSKGGGLLLASAVAALLASKVLEKRELALVFRRS